MNRMVNNITDVLQLLVDWSPDLPNVPEHRILVFVDQLESLSETLTSVMDSQTGWIDPFDNESLDVFERNVDRLLNQIR